MPGPAAPGFQMHRITLGSKAEQKLLVTSEVASSFMGVEGARVLSTPHMIGYMERTCRDLVLAQLDPGYDTVGTHVDVYHLAAAPVGACVRFLAEIVRVSDRRMEFRVEAWNENEKIGEGAHERAIVSVARFATRIAAKQQNEFR